MTTQELTRYDVAPLAPVVTEQQIDLIKRTVAAGATDAELQLYLYDCQRHGVHPLDKLLHFTKRSNKYTPITSIDLLRSRAADTGELAGIDDPQYRGEASQSDFTATATVYRIVQGQRCPFSATARWSEYKPDQDHMWRKMPYLMLGKCAEALALRKAFPRQLAGLYAQEEMDQAGPVQIQQPAQAVRPAQITATNGAPLLSEPQRKMLFALWKEGGFAGELQSWILENYQCELPALSKKDASAAIELLQKEIAEAQPA